VTDPVTPMMRQYRRIKEQHPDKLLFFRLGDFYEMFFEDAAIAARELEITLTGRDAGTAGRVPMAGVPHHAAQGYIARLLEKGYRIAVCDQVEDPRQAKGLVRREVVRVVTPGTVTDEALLDERGNNYLVALAGKSEAGPFGLSYVDCSTGEFATAEVGGPAAVAWLRDELSRLSPSEILAPPGLAGIMGARPADGQATGALVVSLPDSAFDLHRARQRILTHFGTAGLEPWGCAELPLATVAAGAILAYLSETHRTGASHITRLVTYAAGEFMPLDQATRRNLELTRNVRDGGAKHTLLWVLDHTVTSMGGRALRQWVEKPLVDLARIQARLRAVTELWTDSFLRADLRERLRPVRDLERLAGRVALGTITPRDLLALAASIEAVPGIKSLLEEREFLLKALASDMRPLEEVAGLIRSAIAPDPAPTVTEGGIIRDGYSADVDGLRALIRDGRNWIATLEADEKTRTGIRSLKVGFNRVFGYYIELTNANLAQVPADYQRRQTLAGAERFVTPALKEKEAQVLGAEDRLTALEYDLFRGVREAVAARIEPLMATARALSAADALASLAEAASRERFTLPDVDDGVTIRIVDGRHPVIEKVLPAGEFVPNDAILDGEDHRLLIVTGPNMGGKSTYLRQVALAVLMAQIGSFVPARSARIGLVDRIFTRVGASDDLVMGQSTFMVEMSEVSRILNHATSRSLIVLDEVGRGTATFDGLSIAWAVAEYVLERTGARTLFATHYHELTQLEELLFGVRNFNVAVREEGRDIIFLRKIVRGGADRSYGIQVARLAGLPDQVLDRARHILHTLEASAEMAKGVRQAASGQDGAGAAGGGPARAMGDGSGARAARGPRVAIPTTQLSFFEVRPDPLVTEISSLNVLNMTPMEALQKLLDLQERARKG
jgi:DNA mismatch repair protein MutS